uniref:biotin--[acetyl-CoA-carboxylase] ligase n=1 Tax=Flavobacterium sp. TaxID=239 RepID=UPI00404755D3
MAQNSNSNFKFSPWMSIVLVLTIFSTISLFSDGLDLSNPGKTSLSKFNEYLNAGQVDKVIFTNTKATVFLKKEALKDKRHDKVKNDITGKLNTKGPHYTFEIKWPNDILADNKKIAGILIENSFKSQHEIQSIIGVGINVNQDYFENLPQASSMFILENKIFDKEELMIGIVNELKKNLEEVKSVGEDYFWNKYHDLLFKKGKVSAFEDKLGVRFVGKIIGVNKEGKLKVELENEAITFYDLKEIKLLY